MCIRDRWAPADFALLPDEAFEWLAKLLRLIEDGKPWPAHLSHTKAAYMEKDPEDRMNPVAYRVLQLLPNLYRRWAAMRLRDLEDLVQEWRMDEMYAGVAGQGAHDGAYTTSVYCEVMKLMGIPFTGRGGGSV